ncbi:MAG: formate dehydrogenase [Burkholderiales bacterium]|nr:formate dehydrogenase [Burkholderiales bacterium]
MSVSSSKLSRRTLFAGAGTVGAVAATVGLLPTAQTVAQAPAVPQARPERGGGYALSEHVKQYYKTTRV